MYRVIAPYEDKKTAQQHLFSPPEGQIKYV